MVVSGSQAAFDWERSAGCGHNHDMATYRIDATVVSMLAVLACACGDDSGTDETSATDGSTSTTSTPTTDPGTATSPASTSSGVSTSTSTGGETDTTTTTTTETTTTAGTTDGPTGSTTTGGTTGGELCDETMGSTGYMGGPEPRGPLEGYLKSDVAEPSQEFGRFLAMDEETIVACALTYEVDGVERGAAFVFVRDDEDRWREQAILIPPEADRDLFCSSVAIDGDTIVVGAPEEDGDGSDPANNDLVDPGAAFVYTRCGWNWELTGYLKPTVVDSSDDFGRSVAIDGDTIVVGAPEEDSSSTGVDGDPDNDDTNNAGAAYVFTRTDEMWSQAAYLKPSHTDPGDAFGDSVAVSGTTVVVGTPNEGGSGSGIDPEYVVDGTDTNSGAAFVFVEEGGSWSQQAYLKPGSTRANMDFGEGVDIDGDTLVVASPGESGTATGVNGNPDAIGNQSGAAYVFVRSGLDWSQQAYVKASNTEANDGFATSIALSGDTLIVGAPREDSASTVFNAGLDDNTASSAGAAYTYTRSMGTWSVGEYIKAPNASSTDLFGTAVGFAIDTFVVSAQFEDSSATGVNGDLDNDDTSNNGAVYVFVP